MHRLILVIGSLCKVGWLIGMKPEPAVSIATDREALVKAEFRVTKNPRV